METGKTLHTHDTLEASRAARATQPRVAGAVMTRGDTGQSGWTATRSSVTVGRTVCAGYEQLPHGRMQARANPAALFALGGGIRGYS